MDMDDLPQKKTGPLSEVEKEDLYTLSAHELSERIGRLQAEIKRAEVARNARGDSRSAAEALFSVKSES